MKKETSTSLTPIQVGNFVAFGEALRKVHARLLAEGYKIENGTITKPSPKVIPKSEQPIYNKDI